MAPSYSTTTVTPVSARTQKFPVLRIMSGPCNSPAKIGNMTILCPCKNFNGTSRDGQLKLDTPCEDCCHPLGQHGDAEEQGSSHLQISPILDPYLSDRSETVSELAALIDEQKVVHVRGTPASGKTTLARLLEEHYKVNGRKSFFIDTWREQLEEYPSGNTLYGRAWSKLDGMIHKRFNAHLDFVASGTILIIDEAQRSYSDDLFWNSIIKPLVSRGQGPDISFCLFCCYGSPGTGVETELDTHVRFTPAEFRLAQRVTLTPQSHPSPQIGLFFTQSEFTDAAQRLIANPHFQQKFTLHPDAEEYLFSLTNGHPGGLSSVLEYIHNYYRHRNKNCSVSQRVITREDVVDRFKDDRVVWENLLQEPISRSLPKGDWLTTEVADLLAQVLEEGNVLRLTLEEGNVPCEPKLNPAAEMCYKRGWLHRMQIRRELGRDKDVYVLPSRLHEKWIEYHISTRQKSLPSEFETLRDLTLAILRQFSSSNLRYSSPGKILSSGAQPKPIEAQYQDEFYRCFNKIAGRGVPICSEWSRTTGGQVDFYIPGQKWAVEIVREQDRLNEHIMRFHENGQYYSWVKHGMIDDWIIVNCTTSPPICGYGETRLIHAVFKNDYKTLEILDNHGGKLQIDSRGKKLQPPFFLPN